MAGKKRARQGRRTKYVSGVVLARNGVQRAHDKNLILLILEDSPGLLYPHLGGGESVSTGQISGVNYCPKCESSGTFLGYKYRYHLESSLREVYLAWHTPGVKRTYSEPPLFYSSTRTGIPGRP